MARKLTREYWRRINGFNYSVSSRGRVRMEAHTVRNEETFVKRRLRKTHFITPFETPDGMYVILMRDRKKYSKCLRKLVADAFIPPANEGAIHLRDGNPYNCSVENVVRRFRDGRPTKHFWNRGVTDKEKSILRKLIDTPFKWGERKNLSKKLGLSGKVIYTTIQDLKAEQEQETKISES